MGHPHRNTSKSWFVRVPLPNSQRIIFWSIPIKRLALTYYYLVWTFWMGESMNIHIEWMYMIDECELCWSVQSIGIHIKKSEDGGYINNQQDRWEFKFDGILHNASQEAVYDVSAATIVNGLFEGYNGNINNRTILLITSCCTFIWLCASTLELGRNDSRLRTDGSGRITFIQSNFKVMMMLILVTIPTYIIDSGKNLYHDGSHGKLQTSWRDSTCN